MNSEQGKTVAHARYGMVIDLDACAGCGACMVACAVENNVAPAAPNANERTGITWMRVNRVENGLPFPESRTAFVPMLCQQCDHHTPCVSVCPQQAVELDPSSGIVGQIPVRCLGCRYCMTACSYHARYFNWRDPVWPEGMEATLNPDVSTRMRGVVEKCNFCSNRLQAARAKAAMDGGREVHEGEYVPACGEACPNQAIVFGDLNDEKSGVAQLARGKNTFRMLEKLGSEPKVYYRSEEAWVRKLAEREEPKAAVEAVHG